MRAQRRHAVAGNARQCKHGATGERRTTEQGLDVRPRCGHARRLHAVDLGERHRAALHTEQIDDLQVLARLRHHAVVRRHHQQHEVDAGRAGEHVVHEALVSRHVDEAEHRAVGQRVEGITEVDGDAARFFFLQAIGVDAGERLDERGLAVVDMARGADDHDPLLLASSRSCAS